MAHRVQISQTRELHPYVWQLLTLEFPYSGWGTAGSAKYIQFAFDDLQWGFELISSVEIRQSDVASDFISQERLVTVQGRKEPLGVKFLCACVRLEPEVLADCRKRGINCVDLSGRIFVKRPGLWIDRQLRPRARITTASKKRRRPLGSQGQQILRLLLKEPLRSWNISQMHQASGANVGYVWRMFKRFSGAGWITQVRKGEWRVVKQEELQAAVDLQPGRIVVLSPASLLSRFHKLVVPRFPKGMFVACEGKRLRHMSGKTAFDFQLKPVLNVTKADLDEPFVQRNPKVLVLTTRLSEGVIKHCIRLGISCADLTGRLFLRSKNLLIDIDGNEGLRRIRFRTPWNDPSYLRGTRIALPRIFLKQPKRKWDLKALLAEISVTERSLRRWLTYMQEQGWIKCERRGLWKLTNKAYLLKALKRAEAAVRPKTSSFLKPRHRFRKAIEPEQGRAGEGTPSAQEPITSGQPDTPQASTAGQ